MSSSCARQNDVNAHIILPGAHRSARHMRRTFDTCFTLHVSLIYHLYVLFVWISYQARFGLKISYPAIIYNGNRIVKLWEFYRSHPSAGNKQSLHIVSFSALRMRSRLSAGHTTTCTLFCLQEYIYSSTIMWTFVWLVVGIKISYEPKSIPEMCGLLFGMVRSIFNECIRLFTTSDWECCVDRDVLMIDQVFQLQTNHLSSKFCLSPNHCQLQDAVWHDSLSCVLTCYDVHVHVPGHIAKQGFYSKYGFFRNQKLTLWLLENSFSFLASGSTAEVEIYGKGGVCTCMLLLCCCY